MSSDETEREFRQAAELIASRQVAPWRWKTPAQSIGRILARTGVGQQQARHEVLEAWATVTGPAWSGRAIPGALRRGRLDVAVPDSMTLQELGFLETGLVASLRDRLPGVTITGLRFRVDPSRFQNSS